MSLLNHPVNYHNTQTSYTVTCMVVQNIWDPLYLSTVHTHTHSYSATTHFIIVVQPHSLQRHYLLCLPVLGLEYSAIRSCWEVKILLLV